MMTTEQIIAKYGQPGDIKNFVQVNTPFPMRISWDLKTIVHKITCHKLIADPLYTSLADILTHYGSDKVKQFGIDIFGGCFSYRQMRGGKDWSRHSWAIAIDLDPLRNQLKWKKDRAQFAKPEYKPMIDIFYKHGFINLGVESNYDWMHFEISS